MKKIAGRESAPEELVVAMGLVWGHLSARQFEQADVLARGCLRIWPEERRLILMAAYAAVELSQDLDERIRTILLETDCKEWTELVMRRADDGSAAPSMPLR